MQMMNNFGVMNILILEEKLTNKNKQSNTKQMVIIKNIINKKIQ